MVSLVRNALVADLAANLLGPRVDDPEETLHANPISEYVTGILSPDDRTIAEDESGIRDSELSENSDSFDDDDAEPAAGANPFLSPALDPQKLPSSMGMSFCIDCKLEAKLDVCVTWARYVKAGNAWKRHPRCAVFSPSWNSAARWRSVTEFGSDGKPAVEGREVRLHVESKNEDGMTVVDVRLVNCMCPEGERADSEHHVFQPQIRISCPDGVTVVPRSASNLRGDDEEAEFETLYADSKVLGRGHMTSVVWKDIDPEILGDPALQGGGASLGAWVDGTLLSDADRAKFARADIRTEFVPLHLVMAPDVDSWPGDTLKPPLDAEFYSNQYDPAGLREALEPFNTAYKAWVDKLRSVPVANEDVKRKVIREAERTRERISDGIDFLCTDDDARLAFCFASRALHQQSVWTKRQISSGSFKFRPFQLGFILLSARSTLDPESSDRDVCDLLWVPTGTGKTEAYLFLVAMTAAYRRLKAQQREIGDRTGAGVSVISRYTLRLLTIQQFRRTLELFLAMEYLRVFGMDGDAGVGWRPPGFRDDRDFLWGTTMFSVGLWVGRNVTPNKLSNYGPRGSEPGAKQILQNPEGQASDPAQVLDCPACGAVLSLPPGGLMPGQHTLHHVIRVTRGVDRADAAFSGDGGIKSAKNVRVSAVQNKNQIFTTSTLLEVDYNLRHQDLANICDALKAHAKQQGVDFEYLSPKSRPGYFAKKYNHTEYDFDIFCPNPACPLKLPWAAGAPLGNANGSLDGALSGTARGVSSPDGNNFVDINDAFMIEPCVSDRIPIPAFTVDEQVYAQLPTIVVATVDKFARLPFEEKSARLFGNVDHHHHVRGYYRGVEGHPSPKKAPYTTIPKLDRPNLVIQDELHLLDGPLGSMVGIYETAISHMASRRARPPKYIASTATIRKADAHVKALFAKSLAVFPPRGLSAGDRLFITQVRPSLDEGLRGRLHVGVCAPGKGPLTPLVRIWSRLRCSINERDGDPHANAYWTITGYFNAVRELAGATSLYRQDIPERVSQLSNGRFEQLDANPLELSSRTQSADLPAYLDRLADRDAPPEALFTTSMFGTGIDVSQLSTMIVNGQPKTSSSYIQATGRVGRRRGAIVVTFYRSTRPRDLDHYEQFSKYHMQLHRFVEPPTVFPFSEGVVEHALGPIIVSLLRNERRWDRWALNESAAQMNLGAATEVQEVEKIMLDYASKQPENKRPDPDDVALAVKICFDRWRVAAVREQSLRYAEYGEPKNPVVLGDPNHARKGKSPVYDDVPTSMRHVEEEAEFEV